MFARRVAGLIVAQLLAAALAFGQQAPSSFEYSRSSGGQIDATPKATNEFTFSLGMSFGRSTSPLLSGVSGRQYNASAGGAIIPDRLWFFGSGELANPIRFSNADIAKIAAQISDRQSLSGSATRTNFATTLPSSFQSLHFTSMLSSSSTMDVSVSRSTSTAIVPAP